MLLQELLNTLVWAVQIIRVTFKLCVEIFYFIIFIFSVG